MANLAELEKCKLFMLDMDGTFYLDNTLLPGAKEFLAYCRETGAQFIFLTNNSSKSATDYCAKLAQLGVKVALDEIFTSADATLLYMQKNNLPANALIIGTPSMVQQFKQAGYYQADENFKAVVLGFDTGITYTKLTSLCNAVRAGLPYIATHPDYNCPVEGGYIPDIGAVIAFVQASTGRLPDVIIGKPNKGIAQAVAEKYRLPMGQICMVGDRLYTDIALGSSGVKTALVLSGETSRQDLAASDIQPDFTFENLADLLLHLQG